MERDYPSVIGNPVHAVISLALGYVFSAWGRSCPTTFEALSSPLIILGSYLVSKGIAAGWFYENELRILMGD